MDSQHATRALFGVERALIGCVHVAALPGTPKASLPVAVIAKQAAAEARHYQDAGLHAVMIENMHDRPYLARSVGPEVVAAMAVVAGAVRDAIEVPVGLQILAGANEAALAVALAAGASFVRVEGFVFAHVADEGLMSSDAGKLLRYRRGIGAEGVRVFADVKKKHSAHAITADVDIADTAHAAEFFLADGLVVTGVATGRAADPSEVRAVAEAVRIPVLVGSGITPENIDAYPEADAFVVGTALKCQGLWTNPVDPARATALRRAFEALPAR